MADQLEAGVVWANTFNRFDPTSPFGGYKESGLRPRGRSARPGGLRDDCPCDPDGSHPMSRLDVRKTYKLYIGGDVPPQRVGPLLRGRLGRRASSSPTPRWARARTCATRSSPRAAAFPGWAGATAYNRGQVLYRVAEVLEGRRRPVRRRGRRRRGPHGPRGGRRRRRRDRPRGSGTPGGPTRSPRCSATSTPSPGPTSTSRRPSRPVSSACLRRRPPRCSGSSRSWPRSSRPATPRSSSRRPTARCRP